jgi:cell division protein FtsB
MTLPDFLGIRRLTQLTQTIAAGVARLEHRITTQGVIMANTVADLNSKLDALIADVRRVLQLVQNAPTSAATQAEVDALAQRLDELDAEVETVSPQPAEDPNA